MLISPCCGIRQAGLDSLGAIDLRNAVSINFGVDLPATVAFDYPTVAMLAGFVSERLQPTSPATPVSHKVGLGPRKGSRAL